jgi:hypothetical protein
MYCVTTSKQTQLSWNSFPHVTINIQEAITIFFFCLSDPGISWEYKLWSELVSIAKVENADSCSSFWVQGNFEEETLRWRYSTGTYFELTLMPTYLKMTFLCKVTVTLKRMTWKMGCRYWTDATETWLFAHVILHLWNVLVLMYYCSYRSWPKSQTERLLVHTRTIFMAFWGNTMKQNRFFHVLRFLHFSGKRTEPDKTGKNYDRLQKITIFGKINTKEAWTIWDKNLQDMRF